MMSIPGSGLELVWTRQRAHGGVARAQGLRSSCDSGGCWGGRVGDRRTWRTPAWAWSGSGCAGPRAGSPLRHRTACGAPPGGDEGRLSGPERGQLLTAPGLDPVQLGRRLVDVLAPLLQLGTAHVDLGEQVVQLPGLVPALRASSPTTS